jgi:hypothetical protein
MKSAEVQFIEAQSTDGLWQNFKNNALKRERHFLYSKLRMDLASVDSQLKTGITLFLLTNLMKMKKLFFLILRIKGTFQSN